MLRSRTPNEPPPERRDRIDLSGDDPVLIGKLLNADDRLCEDPRYGPATGFRIADVLHRNGPLSAAEIANLTEMETPYVRRTCRALAQRGLLSTTRRPNRIGPPVIIYALSVAGEENLAEKEALDKEAAK